MVNSISVERVEKHICIVRGQRVILDVDLAKLYGATTKALNQAVKRNITRFPVDFMFQLTQQEKNEVVTNCDHLSGLKFSPTLPYGFTEHGAIMVASILNTERAVDISIYVVRAFVKMREMMAENKIIIQKINELEYRTSVHSVHIKSLFNAIRQLMMPPEKPKRKIGFRP